jgi:hypothetical protein
MSDRDLDHQRARGGDWGPNAVAAVAIVAMIVLAAIGYEVTYRTPMTAADSGASPSTSGQGGDRPSAVQNR